MDRTTRNTNWIDKRRRQRQQGSLDVGFARNRIVLLTLRREVCASAWHRSVKHHQGTDVPRSPATGEP